MDCRERNSGIQVIEKILLWWLPSIYALIFCCATLLQVYFFNVNDWDYSYFITQSWRIANGWDWCVPFADAGGAPFYAHHFTPFSALLAPLMGLFPSPFTLAVLHACSAGLLAFILPRFVRQIYRDFAGDQQAQWYWTAAFLLLIFGVFAPYLGAFRYASHYTTLVTPFVALSLLCLHQRRFRMAALCCLLVLVAQERASVAVFGIGMYAFMLLKQRRLGVCLCAISCIWFFGAVKVALPLLRIFAGHVSEYAFASSVQPSAIWQEKMIFLIKLFCLTLFLPLCGRRAAQAALCAFPVLAVSLISDRESMMTFSFHYQDIPSVFLLLSMAYGCLWLQGHIRAGLWKPLFASTLVIYCLLSQVTSAGIYTPLRLMASLLTNPDMPSRVALNRDIRVFDDLPENVSLYVQSGLGPRLALHKFRYLACKKLLPQAADESSVVVFSPVCGQYALGGSYAEVMALADSLPGLQLIKDNGRLRIYVSERLAAAEPLFVEKLKAI